MSTPRHTARARRTLTALSVAPLSAAALIAFASVVVAACSGKTVDATDGGGAGTDGGATTDGGPGARPSDCPSSLPTGNDTCSKEGLLCEYGDDYDPLCNTTVVCSSGKWASPIFYGGGNGKCPSGGPPAPPLPSACPATRDAVPEGQSCTPPSDNPDVCAYASKDKASVCSCGSQCPQYPVAQQPCDPDAGITTNCCDTSKASWGCFDGPAYCPSPRPRIGSPCKEGDTCSIDEPAECGSTIMECKDGVWNIQNTSCPVSTRKAKKDIRYVDPKDEAALKKALLDVKLARYEYKAGDPTTHLGFIIEDMPPGSPAVLATRERVDLYGYVSMTVATVQEQQREIDALKAEIAALRAERGHAVKASRSTRASD